MYAWLWRALPGPLPVRLLLALLLLATAVAGLLLVVFPAVEPLLPLQQVTVEGAGCHPDGPTDTGPGDPMESACPSPSSAPAPA